MRVLRNSIFYLVLVLFLAACGTAQLSVELPTQSLPPTPAETIPATAAAVAETPSPAPSETPQPTETAALPTATTAPTAQPTQTAATTQPAPTLSGSGSQTSEAVTITTVHMLNEMEGWGIGQVRTDLNDHLLFTEDGGQTWVDRTPPAVMQNASASGLSAEAAFLSRDQAWAAYYNPSLPAPLPPTQIWLTNDNGQTWTQGGTLDLGDLPYEFIHLSDMGFDSASHGWVMAHLGVGMSHDYIAIFTTTNGGATWQRVLDSNTENGGLMSCQKTSLVFASESVGWLTGSCPGLLPYQFLYRSTDGGKTWDQINLNPPDGQPETLFNEGGNLACGIPGMVYVTPRDVSFQLGCTDFQNNTSSAWLYASHDGGSTWSSRPLPAPFGQFYFDSPDQGWMIGAVSQDSAATGQFFTTTDGGRTWNAVTPTGWTGAPQFVDASTGWVTAQHGDSRALVFTQNGGKNWVELKPGIR